MSKRHPKRPDTKTKLAIWFKQHADLVAAAGLPSFIISPDENWYYFLDNSLEDLLDNPPDFSIHDLTPLQRAALMRLLKTWPNMIDTQLGRGLITLLVEDVENAYSR